MPRQSHASHTREIEAFGLGHSPVVPVRDQAILGSWRRCIDHHRLDPARTCEAYIVPEGQLRLHREESEPLIRIAIGDNFAGAWHLMLVQMAAVTLMMAGTGARSGLLAMGEDRLVLKATIIGILIFHATLLALVPVIGPMGANVAHALLGLVCGAQMIIGFRRKIRILER